MKTFIRVNVIGTSVFGFTVAVALLVFNNQFFDFLGITVSENYDVDAETAKFDEKMFEKTGKTAEDREAGKLLEINMQGMDIDLTNQ